MSVRRRERAFQGRPQGRSASLEARVPRAAEARLAHVLRAGAATGCGAPAPLDDGHLELPHSAPTGEGEWWEWWDWRNRRNRTKDGWRVRDHRTVKDMSMDELLEEYKNPSKVVNLLTRERFETFMHRHFENDDGDFDAELTKVKKMLNKYDDVERAESKTRTRNSVKELINDMNTLTDFQNLHQLTNSDIERCKITANNIDKYFIKAVKLYLNVFDTIQKTDSYLKILTTKENNNTSGNIDIILGRAVDQDPDTDGLPDAVALRWWILKALFASYDMAKALKTKIFASECYAAKCCDEDKSSRSTLPKGQHFVLNNYIRLKHLLETFIDDTKHVFIRNPNHTLLNDVEELKKELNDPNTYIKNMTLEQTNTDKKQDTTRDHKVFIHVPDRNPLKDGHHEIDPMQENFNKQRQLFYDLVGKTA